MENKISNQYVVKDKLGIYLFHISVVLTECKICPLIHVELHIFRNIDYYSTPKAYAIFYDDSISNCEYDSNKVNTFLRKLLSSLKSDTYSNKLISIGLDPDKLSKLNSFRIEVEEYASI